MSNALIDSRCSEEGNDEDYKEDLESNNRQPTPDLVPFRRNVNEEEVTIASDRNEGNDVLVQTPTPNDSPETRMNVEQDYVSAVVVKAKRAAHSLWLLIHAQNCRTGSDRCPHKGCVEAKRVILHLKTCNSGMNGNGNACPHNFNGCQQSRKLLAHHHKCRELRAKQAGRRTKASQHVCLVCSLVARQAKNVLEGVTRKCNLKKQVIASFTLTDTIPPTLHRRDSDVAMPPPPPRHPGLVNIPLWQSPSSPDHSLFESVACDCPASRNQLMLFSEVVAAASTPNDSQGSRQVLGKSLDSSKIPFLALAASALQNLKRTSPNGESETIASPRRSRAESYDERALHRPHDPNSLRNGNLHMHVDPTLEFDLKSEVSTRNINGEDVELTNVGRRTRSASLGMLASACLAFDACGSIPEEDSTVMQIEGSDKLETQSCGETMFPMDEDEPYQA